MTANRKQTYTKLKLGCPSINPLIVTAGECVMRRFPILYLLVGAYFCFANLHIQLKSVMFDLFYLR